MELAVLKHVTVTSHCVIMFMGVSLQRVSIIVNFPSFNLSVESQCLFRLNAFSMSYHLFSPIYIFLIKHFKTIDKVQKLSNIDLQLLLFRGIEGIRNQNSSILLTIGQRSTAIIGLAIYILIIVLEII